MARYRKHPANTFNNIRFMTGENSFALCGAINGNSLFLETTMLSSIKRHCRYLRHRVRTSPRYLLTRRIVSFLRNASPDTPPSGKEREDILKFLQKNLAQVFNYSFALKYHDRRTKVHYDDSTGLRFVLTDEKRRLYFKRDMSVDSIRKFYGSLCIEQDEKSPHYYCFRDLSINSGSVFVDAGAAEGIFTLKFIDDIKAAYLFECDNGWMEALQATFRPWQEKVHIIGKFVSNKDDDSFVSLDKFFNGRENPTLIKIDVEGAESDVLEGADKLLDQGIGHLLVCTYHKSEDEKTLSAQLRKKNYEINPSPGYMLMFRGRPDYSPESEFEFRRGLIHASKTHPALANFT